MTSISVFTCPGGAQSIQTAPDGSSVPACASGGAWVQAELAEAFDPAALNTAELGQASTAGFVILGSALVFVWGGRLILSSLLGQRSTPPI